MSTEVPNKTDGKTLVEETFSKGHKKNLECNIDLILYEDENIHYVYCPALDLIGYGKTKEEALKSWEVVIEEYIKYGLEKNSLAKDLENHGWNIKKSENRFDPPTISWLLQNNEELAEMYDKHNFHKTSIAITVPLKKIFA